MNLKFLVFALLIMASMNVIAETSHPHGFVLGIDGGYGTIATDNVIDYTLSDRYLDITRVPNYEQSHTGKFVWGTHLGYDFVLTQRFLLGIELGYKNLGLSSYTLLANSDNAVLGTYTAEQHAIDLLLTGRYYIWNELNVLVKAGPAFVASPTHRRCPNLYMAALGGCSSIDSDIKPEVAVGFGYSFLKHIDLHAIYTYMPATDNNDDLTNNPSAFNYNGYTLGLSYHFG
jgi:hypothetical protein